MGASWEIQEAVIFLQNRNVGNDYFLKTVCLIQKIDSQKSCRNSVMLPNRCVLFSLCLFTGGFKPASTRDR